MILLLAGTSEAKQIAWGLVDAGHDVTASLAGATRRPEALPVPTRVGGFGGEQGFRSYLRAKGIRAVIDATHPFAARISDRSARVCADLGLPYLLLLRPEWKATKEDDWRSVKGPAEVAAHVPLDATVFLATGRQTVGEYGGLEGRRILVRVVDPPEAPLPFEGGEFVIGRPPFSVEREVALFESLGVTHLVAKNAGGGGGRSKLDAARILGLPVILLRRPAPPRAPRVASVSEVLTWADETCAKL